MATVYLSIGSNLGDREFYLRQILRLLAPVVTVRRVSSLYETAPVGYLAQGPFLNAVVEGETALPPAELLGRIKEVEQQLGRLPAVRYGPRVADVDILSYDNRVLETPELQIPHPRLAERTFVLVPLVEIAPEWRHPKLKRTASELLGGLGTVSGVRLYKRSWWA